ncbi:MAG: glycerate dehydrogenase, partial [Anaerolineae bacterium]|nr:glycerate dehydrogenase [Anaerolineae bacterium]
MLKGIFILGSTHYPRIYSETTLAAIQKHVEIYAPPQTPESIQENMTLLQPADVIFSGWGGPKLDAHFLAFAPNLKVFFYGAGSVRGLVTDEFWDSGILITSAAAANAVPVAEFTLAQIILALKQTWNAAWIIKTEQRPLSNMAHPMIGAYGSTVGLISLGLIGRMVAEHLSHFDVKVIAYDPFVSAEDAAQLGVELRELDDVFRSADVVSLHTPWLK